MTELDINTLYGNIHIYKKGSGNKNIFLLHGSGCDNAKLSWYEVMEKFSDEYTIYAPDLLGYGKSDKPTNLCGEKFYDIHIQSINHIIKHLGLEKFVLAGLSMGGAIAIGYALNHPLNIQTLILVDTWGISTKLPFHKFSYWFIHKTNFTIFQYKLIAKSKWLVKLFIKYFLIGDNSKITNKIIEDILETCSKDNAGKSMQDFQRSSCDRYKAMPFYKNKISRLSMPIIFIHGEYDSLVPVRYLYDIKEIYLNASVYIFKRCKHWSMKEKPEEFVNIVQNNTKN